MDARVKNALVVSQFVSIGIAAVVVVILCVVALINNWVFGLIVTFIVAVCTAGLIRSILKDAARRP